MIVVLVTAIGLYLRSHPYEDPVSREIEGALGGMAGVHRISSEVDENFRTIVVLAEEASAEQATAVLEMFRERVAATQEYRRSRSDIEFRRSGERSSFTAGTKGLGTASALVVRWVALSRAFPQHEMRWTYKWSALSCSWLGLDDVISMGTTGVGDIALKLVDGNGFDAVSETYRRLIREFPDLASANWKIENSEPDDGYLRMRHRYPTELELSAWHRLNADQNPANRVQIEWPSPSMNPGTGR
ncbi:hypothetical protein O3I_028710 [Nocardia brasiliensis ATCC 700358]|uniref:Uncharacterized protein n=1 Tax=Nocardia brasiliensis (strain ATCC 700358 / HUJEG-1) TaxID=1133849 RepID=K0F885_NOCB7|nr:hypothetical protein O3I_028710 [Nocardia brasiliensis ATCC 700358]